MDKDFVLDVLMVCGPERYMPQIALDTILRENIRIRLFFSNAVGTGAADARNNVKNMWQMSQSSYDLVLVTDNDIFFEEKSIPAMITFLEENETFGAIALHRDKPCAEDNLEPPHVNAGPVMYRSSVYEQIKYHNNDGCECQGMSNDIRKLGYRIGYLKDGTYSHVFRTAREDYVKSE